MDKNYKKNFLLIFLLVIVILFLNFYQKEVRNYFYLISSPTQKFFLENKNRIFDFLETSIKVSRGPFNKWNEIKNLKKENQELKTKIVELIAEKAFLQEFKTENEKLRTALGLGLEKEFNLILTQIINKNISEDFLLINKGSKDGIEKNFPVITEQKVLIGKISEVFENFSRVILITNKKSSFDGKVNEIYGMINGKGGTAYFEFSKDIENNQEKKEIKEGDLVITSSLGGIFPSGILIGEIKSFKKDDLAAFQQAEIKPLVNIQQIEKLLIIKK